MTVLLLWLLASGLILLALMGLDKGRAKGGGLRIAEATLFSWAILGGAWGGLAGMGLFRHKTRHRAFQWGFPLLTLAHLALVVWLWLGDKL